MPNFDNYQPEFAERFLSCGNYVRLKHTSDALATVLIDIKRYMTAYYAAGKRLKESLQNAADIEEEEAADIKLLFVRSMSCISIQFNQTTIVRLLFYSRLASKKRTTDSAKAPVVCS